MSDTSVPILKKANYNHNSKQNTESKKLVDNFSGNEEAMKSFLAFCFFVQRVNTGGINDRELEALYSIKTELVNKHGIDTDMLKFVINAINSSEDIYKIFSNGSKEFEFVQKQNPIDYCEIMAKYLAENSGFLLRLKFTGNIQKDLQSIQSIHNLFISTHIEELLSISSDIFSLELINPWEYIQLNINQPGASKKNTAVVVFEHPQGQAASFLAIKSLNTIKNWFKNRMPEDEIEEIEDKVIERPSKIDKDIDREKFLAIEPNFITLSQSRSYNSSKLNSELTFIDDIENNDSSRFEADEPLEFKKNKMPLEDELEVVKKKRFIRVRNLLHKTKDLFLADLPEDDTYDDTYGEELEHYLEGYDILMVDFNGQQKKYSDLLWVYLHDSKKPRIYRKIIKQIFHGCAFGLKALKLDVKKSIVGSWSDPSQGYILLVNYEINS